MPLDSTSAKVLGHLSRLVELSDTAQTLDTTPRPKYFVQSKDLRQV